MLYTCTVCKHTKTEETGLSEALGHTFTTEVVAPTCSAQGYTREYCTVCGYEKEYTNVTEKDPNAHTYDMDNAVIIREPTCAVPGVAKVTCTECGYTTYQTVTAEHTWDEGTITKEPTCTEGGEKTVTCTVCGAEEKVSIPNLGGHQWIEDLVDDVTNVVYKECSVCGEREITWSENDDLKDCFAGNHTPVEIPETETHYAGSKCSVCGTILEEPLAKCDHENTQRVNAVEATCTEDGYTGDLVCQDCDQTIEDGNVVPATGHTVITDAAVEATCTTDGKTEGSHCSVCDTVIVEQETVPAKGHTEEILPGKTATCTETGLTVGKKCSVCGEVLVAQEEIPMVDHTEEVIPGKEATCTETGLTVGKKCSVCGAVIVAQETISAKGHTSVDVPEVPATEESAGTTAGTKCSVCGEILSGCETIPPLSHEHVWDDGVETKAPTCTEAGEMTYTCSACGETRVETIPAKGHSYTVSVYYIEDYTKVIYTYTCSSCGDSYEEAFDL